MIRPGNIHEIDITCWKWLGENYYFNFAEAEQLFEFLFNISIPEVLKQQIYDSSLDPHFSQYLLSSDVGVLTSKTVIAGYILQNGHCNYVTPGFYNWRVLPRLLTHMVLLVGDEFHRRDQGF
jgi:hypothetical protein